MFQFPNFSQLFPIPKCLYQKETKIVKLNKRFPTIPNYSQFPRVFVMPYNVKLLLRFPTVPKCSQVFPTVPNCSLLFPKTSWELGIVGNWELTSQQ